MSNNVQVWDEAVTLDDGRVRQIRCWWDGKNRIRTDITDKTPRQLAAIEKSARAALRQARGGS